MDASGIAAILTALGGATAAIIGALVLFRRATIPHNAAVSALRSLWDWVEFAQHDEKVPARVRTQVLRILHEDDEHDGPDPGTGSRQTETAG